MRRSKFQFFFHLQRIMQVKLKYSLEHQYHDLNVEQIDYPVN